MTDESRRQPTVGRVDGENVIFTQSWLNQIGLLFCTCLLGAAAVYLTIEFPSYALIPLDIGTRTMMIPFIAVLPIIFFSKATFRIYNERFVLTPEYLIHVTGRLTWRERSVRLEYSRIQEIEISESIWQRILGLGDVILIPIAGITNSAMTMKGLRHPRGVKDMIREREKGETTSAF